MARKVLKQAMDTSLYDLSKMTKYELREYLAPVRDAVNKRVHAIKKAGVPSPALKSLESSGGLLSSKGADKKMLISEIQRGKAFLNLKTGSVKGAKEYLKDITKQKSEAQKVGIDKRIEDFAPHYFTLSDRNKGRYWETLHKLKQDGFQMSPEQYDTNRALIRTAFKGKRPDEAFLRTIPSEAKQYVSDRSYLPGDELYAKGKLRGDKLDAYWTEKVAKMIEAFDEWRKDNVEIMQ